MNGIGPTCSVVIDKQVGWCWTNVFYGPRTTCWMALEQHVELVCTTIFCDQCWTNVTPIQLQTELVSSKLVLISNFNIFEVKQILPGK